MEEKRKWRDEGRKKKKGKKKNKERECGRKTSDHIEF